ncbi:deoxyribodipyrimidine photo-lyase [Pelosinus sp. sgz500959]|uniref:deoxyribodipyrimidine photo-lyase n=1 Tax=Pelosinus sp. sgz500959 TaxID=3242472 RepID=UPI003671F76E
MNQQRIRILNDSTLTTKGPIVYWMSRDQRAQDNWALLYAQKLAIERQEQLLVVFCLVPTFLEASIRQYGFMLRGLIETFKVLTNKNIPCYLLQGAPHQTLPPWLAQHKASLLVTDFDPLKIKRHWKDEILATIQIPCHEVDAHNIVPCWIASQKLEYAAYTLRPKINKLLPQFLEDIPQITHHPISGIISAPLPDLELLFPSLQINHSIKEINWLTPGSQAAQLLLNSFIEKKLPYYDTQSNDPTKDMQSNLSPYLHFGQLSPQRVALSILRGQKITPATESFLEELIVRRELADNFCYYNPHYDNIDAFHPWAHKTLAEHFDDLREYYYSLHDFEQAHTHDELWNAAQRQMITTGKMHGYVRMYWAKKILEWSETPQQAMKFAIYLNDKYQLDGRDPNGYAGIAWSIGGVHDRAWGERKVFGKIRYMNYNGMKRKFDIKSYINAYRE